MANIKKLTNGKYQARIYIGKLNGKSKFKKITCDSLRECKAKAKEIEFNASEILNSKAPSITVQQAVQSYITNRSNILSPATLRGYHRIAKNHFKSIADIPIDRLTQAQFQISVNKDSSMLSPKTVKNIYALVIKALKLYGITMKADYPQIFKNEIDVPTKKEVEKLFELSKGTDLYLPIQFAAMCGLRRSEICALEWSDIDFKNRMIFVNKAMVPDISDNYILKSTKSNAGTRYVKIPLPLFNELKKYRGIGKIISLNPEQVSRLFYWLIRKNFTKKIRFHDLRHYYASIMLCLNIPDKYAMKFIGHSTPEMLKRTYQHIFKDEENKFLDVIDSYFSAKK